MSHTAYICPKCNHDCDWYGCYECGWKGIPYCQAGWIRMMKMFNLEEEDEVKMMMAMNCPACGRGGSISSIPNIYCICVCPHCETKIIVMGVEMDNDRKITIESEIYDGDIDPELWERRDGKE